MSAPKTAHAFTTTHNPATPQPPLDCSYPLWWMAMNAGLDTDGSGTDSIGRLKVAIDGCDEDRSIIPHTSLPALTATATLAPLSGYPLLLTKSCQRGAALSTRKSVEDPRGSEQSSGRGTEQNTRPGAHRHHSGHPSVHPSGHPSGHQPMAPRTCFRQLWVGGAAHSITRNERFGSFRPKGVHPDNVDEGCHQHQLQVHNMRSRTAQKVLSRRIKKFGWSAPSEL